MPPCSAVILLAAGQGTRVGAAGNKVLLPLAGLPLFAWPLRMLLGQEYVDQVVVVVREQDRSRITDVVAQHFPGDRIELVVGGETRHGSEWNALQAIAGRIDEGLVEVVAIHDAARPLASAELFRAVVESAAEHGGALPVREQSSLLARDPVPSSAGSPDVHLVAVQTPQAFRARALLDAYRVAEREGFTGTDTATCVERFTGLEIRCVPSPATNLKVTFHEDVALAERLVQQLG